MIIRPRFEFTDDELRAIKSYIEGKPRRTKAKRAEVERLLREYMAHVISVGEDPESAAPE